jgi:hypothetical protein
MSDYKILKSKKFWCKHIHSLEEKVDGTLRYSWWMNFCQVRKNWKFCPICRAERPNIKAKRSIVQPRFFEVTYE